MNFKFINLLGILLVFFGLLTLMFVHLKHNEEASLEKDHDKTEKFEQYYHILVGFPVSVLGAMLLILAERHQLPK